MGPYSDIQFIADGTLYDTIKHRSVVRHIHVSLDEHKFARAKEGKGNHRTWEEAIMEEIAVPLGEEDIDGPA